MSGSIEAKIRDNHAAGGVISQDDGLLVVEREAGNVKLSIGEEERLAQVVISNATAFALARLLMSAASPEAPVSREKASV